MTVTLKIYCQINNNDDKCFEKIVNEVNILHLVIFTFSIFDISNRFLFRIDIIFLTLMIQKSIWFIIEIIFHTQFKNSPEIIELFNIQSPYHKCYIEINTELHDSKTIFKKFYKYSTTEKTMEIVGGRDFIISTHSESQLGRVD